MNGNDILEFEEENRQRLEEDWCIKMGYSVDLLDDIDWYLENITENQDYWMFVDEEEINSRGD